MPGLHITDHQMRLYMSYRQTHDTAVAAAKAGFSTATGYRVENDVEGLQNAPFRNLDADAKEDLTLRYEAFCAPTA